MGIIAWIVLGLAAGLIANMLIPGRRQQGLILTCVIGIVGALAGGWAATKIFHIHSLQGFFNLSTWITAVVGAAILLLVYHLVTSRSGRSRRRGLFAHRKNCPGCTCAPRSSGGLAARRHGSAASGCPECVRDPGAWRALAQAGQLPPPMTGPGAG